MKAIVKTNLQLPGQTAHYVGKVRDVYSIEGDYLVMVVSDRISAFDVVLPALSVLVSHRMGLLTSKALPAERR